MENLPALVTEYGLEIVESEYGDQLKLSDGTQYVFSPEPIVAKIYNPQSLGSDELPHSLLEHIVYPERDEVLPHLDFYFLGVPRTTRTLWPPDTTKAKIAECASSDGETPSTRIEHPKSDICGRFIYPEARHKNDMPIPEFKPVCEFAQWNPKPKCTNSLCIALLDTELMVPVTIWVKGVAITEFTTFIRKYVKALNANRIPRKGQSLDSIVPVKPYRLTAQKAKDVARVELKFTPLSVEPEEVRKVLPIINFYKRYVMNNMAIKEDDTAITRTAEVEGTDADITLGDDQKETSKASKFDI